MDTNIFPNANLIDYIRQACINLQVHPSDDDILNFLKQTMKNLKTDISIYVLNELLAAIISCFTYNSKFFTSFFPHLFKRSKLNTNFIIVNTLIISDYIYMQSKLPISEYQSFIDEEITEISSQIQQSDKIPLEIFGHKISPYYKNKLIVSLLLTSTLTDKLFLSTFSYLFHHDLLSENPKSALLLHNFSKTCTIQISPQNEASCDYINEFIKQNGEYPLTNMNEQAISLIESVVIFIKSQEKKKIKGLKKETILQFLAVLIIIIKKYKIQEKVTFSAKVILNLIIEGINYLELNTFPVLNTSIDLILENYFYINTTLSIPFEFILEIFTLILQKIISKKYKGNAIIFLETVFDLSEKVKYYNYRDQIGTFLNQNASKLFEIIFNDKYFDEINNIDNYKFKINKLNLKYIDQQIIINNYFECDENIYPIISFLHYSCINISKQEFDKISDKLWSYLKLKAKEEAWNEVLLICQFMINNKLNFNKEETTEIFPSLINNILFGYNPNEIETIDELLDNILNDAHLEENNEVFKVLFMMMIEDRDLLQIYLTFLFGKNISSYSYDAKEFLKLFNNEYEKNYYVFLYTCKNMFLYKPDDCRLVPQFNYIIDDIKLVTNFGLSIIDKLFETIKIKNNNYQVFICLMNIACAFPSLFTKDIKRVFDSVYPTFDDILLLFDKKTDDDNLLLIKTAYSALHFLASTLLSPTILDYFYEWLFNNIFILTDGQVLCSFIILNMLNKSENIEVASIVYILKYNFIDTASQLLKREIKEGYFKNCYKDNIYKFIESTYLRFTKLTSYILIQIDELMKIKNPIFYFYNTILFKVPDVYKNLIHIGELDHQSQFDKFVEKLKTDNDFWLTYDLYKRNLNEPSKDAFNEFTSKLTIDESNCNIEDLPEMNSPLTVHMIRYLVNQQSWTYCHILYSQKVYLTNETFEYYFKIINDLNQLRTYADEHKNNEDEIDIELFSIDDYILPQFCQDNLIKTIVNDAASPLLNSQCLSSLSNLIDVYTSNNVALTSFLPIISHFFNESYDKCIRFTSSFDLKVMYNLIKVLKNLTNKSGLNEYFFDICGNNLIDITLSPEFRSNPIMLKKMANLLSKFDELPIRAVQLIPFMIILRNEKVANKAGKLYKKFSDDQLQCVNKIILNAFDYELSNEKKFSIVMSYISIFPSIIQMRRSKSFSILKGLIKKFNTQKNDKMIDLIGLLLSGLAPNRKDLGPISPAEGKISKIPSLVKNTSPEFWNFFEKHMEPILSMITDNPSLIYKFEFLLDYPELVSFKARISLFREKMKLKIDKSDHLILYIDPDEILSTSYQCIIGETTENLLKEFYVVFQNNVGTVDMGGPRREWFTKLAKEIFNQNYALFDCSKSFCYQPSSISYIHDDHLQHFRFVGIFIARALIEGQCIDAHLTTSFCKQILHREPNLSDLQDVDEELFNSLNWMLDNDVDSLELYFEVDYEEFGVHKTIPLKENGSEIQVTNENKKEFVHLNSQFALSKKIESQLKAFCDGFNSLIPLDEIKFFTPNELDLLICGVPDIDVNDFIKNCTFGGFYSKNHPVILRFFNVIKKWDNENLVKLFCFMTGSSRIPANGFKEFCEISGYPLKIETGDIQGLPRAHTCFNTIDLPPYRSDNEMESKLLFAIQECDSFGII